MSKTTAPAAFRADEFVIAWQPFMVRLAGEHYETVFQKGARLRGDHPAVLQCPQNFTRDGLDDQERAQVIAQTMAELEPPAPDPLSGYRVNLEREIPDEELVLCIKSITVAGIGADGKHLGADRGSKVRKTSPLVKRHPDHFVSITNGVARERALVALTDMSFSGHDPKTGEPWKRQLYRGQWVDPEDDFAKTHPIHFRRTEHL